MTDVQRDRRIDALTPAAFAAQVSAALTDLGIDEEEIARLACRYRDTLHQPPMDAAVPLDRLPNEVQAVRRIWHLIADDIVAAARRPHRPAP
jgi:1,6-anhydro-N-acetylmuramate kinase